MNNREQQNVTDLFVRNLMAFAERPIADHVMHHAQKCYLDYLGCVLAGCWQNKAMFSSLEKTGLLADGECSVLGSDKKLSFRDAGFVNGFNAHSMELDDGHRYAMLHIEAPVFSAMLALCEKEKLSVDAFYKGIVVGYEATIRMSKAMQPWHKVRGYHSTGTCATIGVAMAAAASLGFDFHQTKSALTAAASSAAGLLEILSDDSELKPYNVGRAVMDGLTSAYIGKAGYEGPKDILGGKRGFLNVMTDTPHVEFLEVFSPNEDPSILGNFFKPYPACRHCHSTIDAALHIAQEHNIDPSTVKKVKIGTYKLALTGHDHTEVNSSKSAMMSIPYGAVVALVEKKAGLAQYKEEIVKSHAVQDLLSKVEISENEELTQLLPDVRGAIVEVETTRGTYQCRIDQSLGEPENPMDDHAIVEKFLGLTDACGMERPKAEEMVNKVFNKQIITNI